ncbi:hypothetical protein H2203_002537 [Taxawa tesnikishii (nom. ined.)]|nr:hypothetical protein H2203_002537 [Dothideales sp. JES 119]
MAHKDLKSKADMEAALQTTGKYVLIYFYEGHVNPKADEMSQQFADTTDAYRVNIQDLPQQALDRFKVTQVPTIIIFKDGGEAKRVDGVTPEKMKDVAAMLKA